MPSGYLVTLGDTNLDSGDLVTDPLVSFTTAVSIGAGQWTWSGTYGGTTYTNELEPGQYYEATDGNVYFVPDYGPVDTITSADVTSAPAYSTSDGIVTGTGSADLIDGSFIDADGDQVGTGDDTVNAGAGDDTIIGGSGADTIDGGTGSDTASYAGSTSGVNVNLSSGTNTGGDAEGDVLSSIENVIGSSFNDTLTGDTADNVIDGADGADQIDGGDGNDTIFGGAGDDTVYGGAGDDTIDGGTGDDVIYGDTGPGAGEVLNWDAEGADGTDIAAGFTQDTGEMDVTVSFANNGNNNPTYNVESTDVNYIAAGEPFNTTSSARLFADGDGDSSTTTIDFAASSGSTASDDVQNVSFRISDIDWASGDFQDQVTIRAFDANGNEVTVNITASSNDTLSGNTITAGLVAEGTADEGGSALIEIAGPVSSITIVYGNLGTGTQAIRVTDIHFDTIVDTPDGNDIIDGGAGDDIIYGQDGNDTLTGGLGDDQLSGGAGDDTFNLAEGDTALGGDGDDTFNIGDLGETGSGTINIIGGESGETTGDTIVWTDADKSSLTITNADDVNGGLSGTFTLLDGTVVTFSEIENIVCFASDTEILTPYGKRLIKDLKAGDLVITRDNGLQPIRWIGTRTVPALNKFAPIWFAAGSLPNLDRTLLVSPQHRMLVNNHRSELYLGECEVLASAKHMVNGTTITRQTGGEVTYMHMLFDQHEIVYANGTASESFHPADIGLNAISDEARDEVFSLFPQLRSDTTAYGDTARKCLRKHEALMVA